LTASVILDPVGGCLFLREEGDTVNSALLLEEKGFPPFLYGTAWKEDQTERLTSQAIAAGFWGIDTANQRRHYVESAAL
jgi:hypothetical protein